MDGDRSETPLPDAGSARDDDAAAENVKPARDGPPEVEDAAEQEVEYPADETLEG
jgi:hypothetical protein